MPGLPLAIGMPNRTGNILPAVSVDPNDAAAKITYNGFQFPPALSLRFNVTPVPSESGRTVKLLKGFISVECILTGSDFDATAADGYALTNGIAIGDVGRGQNMSTAGMQLARRLNAKGADLTIQGLGPLDIEISNRTTSSSSQSTAVPDLDNGPSPSTYEISSIINARAYHIVWTCEFTFSPCEDRFIDRTRPIINEVDFSIGYSIGTNGNPVRSITGSVGILNWVNPTNGQTQVNPDLPDGIKKSILKWFPTLPAYERSQSFTTVATRTKIQFSITDTRIGSDEPYPPGIHRCSISHNLRNDFSQPGLVGANQGINFTMNFSGTIEYLPGYSKQHAWNQLVLIIRSRLTQLKTGYMMFGFSVTEEIYGRSLTVDISYRLPATLATVINQSNLFKPINDPSAWATWDTARQKAFEPYGMDTDTFDPSRQVDEVVTVCDTEQKIRYGYGGSLPTGSGANLTKPETIGTNMQGNDIIAYNNTCMLYSDMNVVMASIMGTSDAKGVGDGLNYSDSMLSINRVKTTENVVQTQGTGQHYLVMRGTCTRVGRDAAIPTVSSVGTSATGPASLSSGGGGGGNALSGGGGGGGTNAPVITLDRVSPSQLAGTTPDGYAIYQASWIRVYCVPSLGNRVVEIANVPARYSRLLVDKGGPKINDNPSAIA
jgi:hypothetical protein